MSEQDNEIVEVEDEKENQENKENEYEEICYICRRPESKAGKMIKIPNNICICKDCMQKTFDSMSNSGMNFNEWNPSSLGNMPNISMINLSDLQGMFPRNQQVKKKNRRKNRRKSRNWIFEIFRHLTRLKPVWMST